MIGHGGYSFRGDQDLGGGKRGGEDLGWGQLALLQCMNFHVVVCWFWYRAKQRPCVFGEIGGESGRVGFMRTKGCLLCLFVAFFRSNLSPFSLLAMATFKVDVHQWQSEVGPVLLVCQWHWLVETWWGYMAMVRGESTVSELKKIDAFGAMETRE